MHVPNFSLRLLLIIIAFSAITLALWKSLGEYILLVVTLGSLALFVSSLHSCTNFYTRARRKSFVGFFLVTAFFCSLGPVTGTYSRYDPDWWKTPTLKSTYSTIYNPVGRFMAFPIGPLKQIYVRYLQMWMPKSTVVRDIGWGLKIEGPSNHIILGC